jgi:hypothetical protein
MADPAPSFELREPAPPDALLPADPATPLAWGFGAALVAVAALLGYRLYRARRHAAPAPAALRAQAYQEARAALAALDLPNSRALATQASLILRRYLAAAVNDPSLYETHEEFVARSGSLRNLSETARDACHRGLADLAAVKYAPAEAAVAPAALLAGARELLEILHRGFTD